MAAPTSSSSGPFPWEQPYMAAVLETDNNRLRERIRVAEETLSFRLIGLTDHAEHEAEVHALENALEALTRLKRERLNQGKSPTMQPASSDASSSAV